MHYGYSGSGHGGLWVLMLVAMVVFWGAVAWIIVTLVRHRGGPVAAPGPAIDPTGASGRRILDERFARGEIDEEEYRRRRAVIEGSG